MTSEFKKAMAKLAVLGQDISQMVDCSELIPEPKPLTVSARFPAGFTISNVEQAVKDRPISTIIKALIPYEQCASTPFPTLTTDPGPITSVAPV